MHIFWVLSIRCVRPKSSPNAARAGGRPSQGCDAVPRRRRRRRPRLRGAHGCAGRHLDRVDGRLDGLTGEVETLGRETRELRTELPAQVVAGVLVGFERSAYATDLRTLQAEVAELKADVAELKRASGE